MLKLNVGWSRKAGEPNYGSRGASVHLELEVEAGLVNQPEELQDRIRKLYRLAKSAVDEELNGTCNSPKPQQNGNGQPRSQNRPATQSQCRAIHAIASRQRLDLSAELQRRFGVNRPDDLSISQASQLIDAIKPQSDGIGDRR